MDGQTEVVNQNLGNLLRYLVGDKLGTWDFSLTTAKFAYNNSVNQSTGKSPFEIIYGLNPNQSIDLVSLSMDNRISEPAISFAQYIRDIYADIWRMITTSTKKYKLTTNARCRNVKFNEGDYVMDRIRS